VKRGDDYHLVVALFDAEGGNRITDAEIEARVEPLGLAAETKTLETMHINRTVTFGNFFRMPISGPYQVLLRIRATGLPDRVEARFEYWHPARD
jgi:hypothetical protein